MKAADPPPVTRSDTLNVPASTPDTRLPESLNARVVVEHIRPAVDEGVGGFAIKRTPGETVDVTADVFADGHDVVAAILMWRRGSTGDWHETPMKELGNDRWGASFSITDVGEYEFTVEGWVDRFGTWRKHLEAKWAAAQEVDNELSEGAALLRAAARPGAGTRASGLDVEFLNVAEILESRDDVSRRAAAALDPRLAELMAARPDRSRATRFHPPLRVIADRERARFGSWYEMFPRSATPDPSRSGTFAEAEGMLPRIADMGFDIVYLPPIHPIGRTFRKGRNNALRADAGEPGSPWAIGGPEGGHTAVDPALGTLEDFAHFVRTAEHLRLEVALDLAFQTSPDHPYVSQHPEWFRHRPDGTIKYAENPPKKYQDIYALDFEGPAWRQLWSELHAVTKFWIEHGVRIFRVDNPHTKPLRFWQWMLAEIRAEHPDAIFLAEAFTRPKIMRFLAKAGFNQSYSYFTWRNTKVELTEYFTELTHTDVCEYMRPNLFANTPDILHEYLQHGGRPAFKIRLILAATLGASYGIYSGFELCENVPLRNGSEEYLDSEKYQMRPRQWDQPGHIGELVARMNEIRRENRALQSDRMLRFCNTDNPQILCYRKSTPDGSNTILVVVNLDAHHMQHGWVQVPLRELGIAPDEPFVVRDLLDDTPYTWRGEWNYVRLDPEIVPAHVLRLDPRSTGPRTPGADMNPGPRTSSAVRA